MAAGGFLFGTRRKPASFGPKRKEVGWVTWFGFWSCIRLLPFAETNMFCFPLLVLQGIGFTIYVLIYFKWLKQLKVGFSSEHSQNQN